MANNQLFKKALVLTVLLPLLNNCGLKAENLSETQGAANSPIVLEPGLQDGNSPKVKDDDSNYPPVLYQIPDDYDSPTSAPTVAETPATQESAPTLAETLVTSSDETVEFFIDDEESEDEHDSVEVTMGCDKKNRVIGEDSKGHSYDLGRCESGSLTVRVNVKNCHDPKELKKGRGYHFNNRLFGWSHNWSSAYCSLTTDGTVLCHQVGSSLRLSNEKVIVQVEGKIKKVKMTQGRACRKLQARKQPSCK